LTSQQQQAFMGLQLPEGTVALVAAALELAGQGETAAYWQVWVVALLLVGEQVAMVHLQQQLVVWAAAAAVRLLCLGSVAQLA
jgi:hypothetical protein